MTQVHILRALLDDTEDAGIHVLPILRQSIFIGCVSTRGFREALAPLDDHLQVTLTQDASKTLDISIAHGANISGDRDFETAEEQSLDKYAHLMIDYPATFESCSTLLSIYTYFEDSDVEYVCVRRRGMHWTVVSNPLYSVDLLLTPAANPDNPRQVVPEYMLFSLAFSLSIECTDGYNLLRDVSYGLMCSSECKARPNEDSW